MRDRSALPTGAPPKAGHIAEAWDAPEEILEALGLFDICSAWGDAVDSLLLATLSHHGRPAQKRWRLGTGPPALWKPFASYDPRATAALLRERSRTWFPEAFEEAPPLPDTPALSHLFAGVVALADQIGSNDKLFKYEPAPDPYYIDRARDIATNAVEKLGFQRAERPAPLTYESCSATQSRVRCRVPCGRRRSIVRS